LTDRIRSAFFRTGRLASFLLRSSSRYAVHSPFLFEFTDEVIRGAGDRGDKSCSEKLRSKYLKDGSVITKTDFGPGGTGMPGMSYPVRIGRLARTSLTPPRQLARLERYVRKYKPSKMLEIGTSLGVTAAALASASPSAKVVTLEGCPELSRIASRGFRDCGVENITLITGPFAETLPAALEQLGTVDFVYIDGNHCYEAVTDYFERCLAYSGNETVIVLDDIHASPGMEKAWKHLSRLPRVSVSIDLFHSGWILLRKELSREHFRLRYL
jgi:predicted O-methyltransferase YrrM